MQWPHTSPNRGRSGQPRPYHARIDPLANLSSNPTTESGAPKRIPVVAKAAASGGAIDFCVVALVGAGTLTAPVSHSTSAGRVCPVSSSSAPR